MHDRVVENCLSIHNGNKSITIWNDTLNTLIPKMEKATQLKYYRPISLCNLLYKIVAKSLANRMKSSMHTVIDENQSVFIVGQYIEDNIILGFECNHCLGSHTHGKECFNALKLDINMAYNMVEWSFLRRVMDHTMSFGQKCISQVMDYVSSIRFSILANELTLDPFKACRGLR